MSDRDYVVVEKKVSSTAVLIFMLMFMVFLSLVIQLYYFSVVSELNSSIKSLQSEVRSLRYSASEISRGLEAYRSMNIIVELQMRSMLIKMLRDMGFSEEDVSRIISQYGYGYGVVDVDTIYRRFKESGFSDEEIDEIIDVLRDLSIIKTRT